MSSSAWLMAGIAVGVWVLTIGFFQIVLVPRWRRGLNQSAVLGLIWHLNRHFCRLLHHVRFAGREHLPDPQNPGPMIVVSNHTCSLDPLLIQAGCPFFIRWMMASEMMSPVANDLWHTLRIIPVDRDGQDTAAAREAIRHVKAGGVVGIFPEGGLGERRGEIRPFFEGVGLMIARTRAPVLLVSVEGTPQTPSVGKSLLTPSNAQVRFLERIDFGKQRDVRKITQTLRERLAAATGWTLSNGDAVPRFVGQTSEGGPTPQMQTTAE